MDLTSNTRITHKIPANNRGKRPVVYCRASKEGGSLDEIIDDGHEYYTERGYWVVETVREVGRPRLTLERPGIMRILQLVENGEVDLVLGENMLAFAKFRNNSVDEALEFINFVRLLRTKGVGLEMWREEEVPTHLRFSEFKCMIDEFIALQSQEAD